MSETYKLMFRAVINQCIDDLMDRDHTIRSDALQYLRGDLFESHRKIAGYPAGLRETLSETLLLSKSEQNYIIDLVREELIQS